VTYRGRETKLRTHYWSHIGYGEPFRVLTVAESSDQDCGTGAEVQGIVDHGEKIADVLEQQLVRQGSLDEGD